MNEKYLAIPPTPRHSEVIDYIWHMLLLRNRGNKENGFIVSFTLPPICAWLFYLRTMYTVAQQVAAQGKGCTNLKMNRELPSSGESHQGSGQASGSLQWNCGNWLISTFVMVLIHVELYFHIRLKKPQAESIQSQVGTVSLCYEACFHTDLINFPMQEGMCFENQHQNFSWCKTTISVLL